MIRSLVCLALFSVFPTFCVAQDTLPPGQPATADQLSPEQFAQIVSYALGRSVAQDAKLGGVKIDMRALQTGIAEVEANKPSQRSEEELGQVMQSFALRIQRQIAANNLKAGEDFLAKNAKAPGVKVTPSGLQYKVLQAGTGKTPTKPVPLSATIAAHSSMAQSSIVRIRQVGLRNSHCGASSPLGRSSEDDERGREVSDLRPG